jgi:hypothetical protein
VTCIRVGITTDTRRLSKKLTTDEIFFPTFGKAVWRCGDIVTLHRQSRRARFLQMPYAAVDGAARQKLSMWPVMSLGVAITTVGFLLHLLGHGDADAPWRRRKAS